MRITVWDLPQNCIKCNKKATRIVKVQKIFWEYRLAFICEKHFQEFKP